MSLRVGIAGYGLAGRYFHAPLLKGCGFEVAAVLTTNPVRVGHALQDFPATAVVESMQELVGHNLDLVVVASANLVHAEQAAVALKAGIPVVVDKPMGRNYEETTAIVELSKTLGVPVSTFFNRRWDSDALTIKKVIADGGRAIIISHLGRPKCGFEERFSLQDLDRLLRKLWVYLGDCNRAQVKFQLARLDDLFGFQQVTRVVLLKLEG